MFKAAPSSVDLQDFQFKLHSKLKIFDNTDDSKFKNETNSVAAASRYGLVFIGTVNKTLEVVQLKTIENSQLSREETRDFPKRSINLQSAPTHLALNCDQKMLAVVNNTNECATVTIYSVPSFFSQNVVAVREIRVSATPGVRVVEIGWNPAIPQVYTACKSDGSLGVYTLQENSVDINELPEAAAASCFCWSKKGKRIVVGSTNGTLTQYLPDLKAVKAIQAPTFQGTGPFSVVNVFWLTNYQLVAIYKDASDPEVCPSILIVNAPKDAAINFINYDDICYSYGTLRPPQYYIIHQPTWGVLLVASANSMGVGVLGICQSGKPALWQQWNQIDGAGAELPFSASRQETFPIGFAFDTGVTLQLPWGENQTLPPMPMIHLISHHGVLCSFSVINIRQGVATICTPPESIPDQTTGTNNFNFGTALSTSKPEITSVIIQSPITITTVAATTAAPLVTKPAFSLTQPAISTPSTTPVQAQVSATQISTIVSTAAPTVSTPDSVTSTTSVTSSFGGFAPTTSTTNIFGQPAAASTPIKNTVQAQVSATQIPTIVSTAAPTVSTPDSVTPTTSVTSSFGGFAPTTSTTNIFGQPAAASTPIKNKIK